MVYVIFVNAILIYIRITIRRILDANIAICILRCNSGDAAAAQRLDGSVCRIGIIYLAAKCQLRQRKRSI